MSTSNKRAFDSRELVNLAKTIEFTVKSIRPDADACEVYDHIILVASAMGADIARHSKNPDEAAHIFGDTLAKNILNMMRLSNNES